MSRTRTAFLDGDRWRVERFADDPASVHEVLSRLEAAVAAGDRLPPAAPVLAKMVDAALRDAGRTTGKTLAALQIRASQVGLSRDDRLELATILLGRDIATWKTLDVDETRRIFDALDGFTYIAHLHLERGERAKYAECPAVACPVRIRRRSDRA